MKYHYTYEIRNTSINKSYIGVRSTNNIQGDLGIKYFSSSSDKEFIIDQKLNHVKYKYIILSIFSTREEANKHEIYLHKLNNVSSNPSYYNRSKATSTGFCTAGTTFKLSEETKRKISISTKGLNTWSRGRSISEEHKRNISKGSKGINTWSKDTKQSKSTIAKRVKALTGLKQEIVMCPYCNKSGGKGNIQRYHFDNCKYGGR